MYVIISFPAVAQPLAPLAATSASAEQWRASLSPSRYGLTCRWEERLGELVTRTIVAKQLTISSIRQSENLVVTLATDPPALRKRDLTALEEVVLQLATLYQRLVLTLTPAGAITGLENSAEIAQTWAALRSELVARYGAQDALMAGLLPAIEVQVHDPVLLMASLRYDYVYSLVLHYPKAAARSALPLHRTREFPQFLGAGPLWVIEEWQLDPAGAPGQLCWQVQGQLDEARTDRAAVAQQVAAELAASALSAGPPPDPAALAFAYRATYHLDAATGWPLAVTATLSCQSPAGYAKEYDLTLELQVP